MHKLFLVPAIVACLVCPAFAADLSGTIHDEHDQPLPGATVFIYTAAMKTGTSILCPSCYADCAKKAVTDVNGAFTIKALDEQLVFRVLVVREGFVPQFVTKVDPSAGPISAKLAEEPKDIPANRLLKGRVIDSHGRAVTGAVVGADGCKDGERRWWGDVSDVIEDLAVANDHGEFTFVCKKPNLSIDLTVTARGLARKGFALLSADSTVHDLKLGEGVSIAGRLVGSDGKPIAGVQMGVVSCDRGTEQFSGHYEIGTDDKGQFAFYNLPPEREYFVYDIMSTLGDRGAPVMRRVPTGHDQENVEMGDVPLGPTHSVDGRVVLSDGQPAPAGTRVLLSREEAWDSLQADCDANGAFHLNGIPHGDLVTLSARAKGYHVSSKNKSFEPMNAIFLMGLVDADLKDVAIQLDPGPEERIDSDKIPAGHWQMLQKTRLEGVTSR